MIGTGDRESGEREFQLSFVEETISAYDANAEGYASRYRSVDLSAKIDDFIAYLPTRNAPVLDAGCGPGRDTAALLARGISSVGLDRSLPMLRLARRV